LEKIPFSVYDFFAYLSSGAVIICAADYIWRVGILNQRDVGPIFGVALIILTYVTGQIVAHFSSLVLEQTLVGKILGRPSSLLLGHRRGPRIFRYLFPNYHRALPASAQERVKIQAARCECTAEGEGLFLHAYAVVSESERNQARLDDFRNQYGFARNMAFAFLVSAIAIQLAHWYGPHPIRRSWALVALLAGVALLYRYLKFFRQFSYELFLRYAELPCPSARPE
jgi:hypothetical protein